MTDLSPETVGTTPPDNPRADEGLWSRFGNWLAGWFSFNIVLGAVAFAAGALAVYRGWEWWAYLFGMVGGLNLGFGIAIHDIRAALTAARSHGGDVMENVERLARAIFNADREFRGAEPVSDNEWVCYWAPGGPAAMPSLVQMRAMAALKALSCPACTAGDFTIDRTCHNSDCEQYATPVEIFQSW